MSAHSYPFAVYRCVCSDFFILNWTSTQFFSIRIRHIENLSLCAERVHISFFSYLKKKLKFSRYQNAHANRKIVIVSGSIVSKLLRKFESCAAQALFQYFFSSMPAVCYESVHSALHALFTASIQNGWHFSTVAHRGK